MDNLPPVQESKSQKKRHAHALQDFGQQLVNLPAKTLDKLVLPDSLRLAIHQAKQIKSHNALKRQIQLIGKIMRKIDYQSIQAQLSERDADNNAQTAAFHALELWRTQLIQGGSDAFNQFITAYPDTDSKQLQRLLNKAILEQQQVALLAQRNNNDAFKALFRFLRTCA